MTRPSIDGLVHHLVEQAEADRMRRPRNSTAACRRSRCKLDHLLSILLAEDGKEMGAVR